MTKIPMRVDLTNDEHDEATRLSSGVKEVCEPVHNGFRVLNKFTTAV